MKLSQQRAICSSEQFFKIVDILEQYDLHLTELNTTYNDAMIELSFLKFQNSETSVSSKGFKPTPALLSVDQSFQICTRIQASQSISCMSAQMQKQQHKQKQCQNQALNKQKQINLSLESIRSSRCLKFADRVDECAQQFEQQQQIEREVSRIFAQTKQGIIDAEKIEDFMISRFNVLNNSNLVRKSRQKFINLLETCCKFLIYRKSVLEELQAIERQRGIDGPKKQQN